MRLLSRFQARRAAPAATPGDRVVYAIGDVHGRLDRLDPLLAKIARDALGLDLRARPVLVLLGDYVDRGADSKGVIDRILQWREHDAFETRVLRGNHEEAMLGFLQDPTFGPTWTEYGGAQTLASYGVAPPVRRTDAAEWERARDAFASQIPAAHLEFLTNLESMVVFGDYAFVHAGVRPGVALQDQDEHDLLWIRDDFLSETRPSEKVIVHGHTPAEEPYLDHRRIGVDTGAYATGVLTAVRLHGADRVILQSGRL